MPSPTATAYPLAPSQFAALAAEGFQLHYSCGNQTGFVVAPAVHGMLGPAVMRRVADRHWREAEVCRDTDGSLYLAGTTSLAPAPLRPVPATVTGWLNNAQLLQLCRHFHGSEHVGDTHRQLRRGAGGALTRLTGRRIQLNDPKPGGHLCALAAALETTPRRRRPAAVHDLWI